MKTLEHARGISEHDLQLLLEVKNTIIQFVPTAIVLLYGSVARGAQEPDSDYDILALTDIPVDRDVERRIEDAVYELELSRGVVISVTFHTWTEWETSVLSVTPFHDEVERDAIVL